MRLHVIAAAVLFSATLSAHADATYNLESTTSGAALPLTLSSNGLSATFTGSASVCNATGYFTTLSGNVIIQNLCSSSNQTGPLSISFSQSLSSLSFDFATAQAISPLTVNLFEGATLVGTDTFTPTLTDRLGNGEGFASITGDFNSVALTDADIIAIDNVAAVPAPEPSSLALLATGLLGFAEVVRRRLTANRNS